jgi:hypothetical protein
MFWVLVIGSQGITTYEAKEEKTHGRNIVPPPAMPPRHISIRVGTISGEFYCAGEHVLQQIDKSD